MQEIIIDDAISVDLDMSINAIDQATINSLKDLNIKPFDEVKLIWGDSTLFCGICVDAGLNMTFGQQNYTYTINSPLFLLQKTNIEVPYTTFLQLFLKKCCSICNIDLDYQLDKNPLIYVEEGNYFDALKKSIIYTKNYNARFYMDYLNNKLIFTDKTEGTYPKVKNTINYSFEYITDVINQIQW